MTEPGCSLNSAPETSDTVPVPRWALLRLLDPEMYAADEVASAKRAARAAEDTT